MSVVAAMFLMIPASGDLEWHLTPHPWSGYNEAGNKIYVIHV